MRTEQFTPGPWLVRYDEDRFDSKQSTLKILDGSNDSLNHPQGPLVLARINVIPFAPHMDEPLANARLIASAPEMLQALESIVEAYQRYFDVMPVAWQSYDDHARAIISKAKGQE